MSELITGVMATLAVDGWWDPDIFTEYRQFGWNLSAEDAVQFVSDNPGARFVIFTKESAVDRA